MGLYKYRIFPHGAGKAEAILDTRADVEHHIPHGEGRVVKRYQGRKKLATYRVERDIRGGVTWQMAND